ncbi:MAG: hypothetical protein PHG25_02565 [Candidatus Pacebacteria bacterium]|nr:hypothetical protein [Candidatus Paceibacterota bacterium]
MFNIGRQALLYQQRRIIKQSIRPMRLERHHWHYIRQFLQKNTRSILILPSLIVAQAIIEIGVLIFLNGSIREQIYYALHTKALSVFIISVLCGALLYLCVTYLTIKFERTLVLGLINDIRKRLFSVLLRRSYTSVTNEEKADFIAKVSYHLPLLSLGVDHSLLGSVRWVIMAVVLISLSIIAGPHYIIGIAALVFLGVCVGLISYGIARYFISREVASYSQVIRHVTLTLSELSFTKILQGEQSALDALDARVGVDTYFRIRRDIWLRYLNRVFFAGVFAATSILIIISFSHPELISFLYDPATTILATIISLYAIRFLYESVQTGLYLLPLKLGLFLAIPEGATSLRQINKDTWNHITFISNKIKLFVEGNYMKRVSISLRRGQRYLFTGAAYTGKTALARLFTGNAVFNPLGWVVKIDAKRVDGNTWAQEYANRYFFAPHVYSEKTIGEIIFAKEMQQITEDDIARVYTLCQKYPVFSKIRSKKRFIGEPLSIFSDSPTLLFAVQTLHCIISRPQLIVVDNQWVDSGYADITALLHILDAELPESTLVVFSREINFSIIYNERYVIEQNEVRLTA